jgi:hypothetical protein
VGVAPRSRLRGNRGCRCDPLAARRLIPVGPLAASLWGALIYPVGVPLVILVALVVSLLIVAARALLGPPRPPCLTYREDNFLGVVWRWSYDEGHRLAPLSIRPYCPQCKTGLRSEWSGYTAIITVFICDECGFKQEANGTLEQSSTEYAA